MRKTEFLNVFSYMSMKTIKSTVNPVYLSKGMQMYIHLETGGLILMTILLNWPKSENNLNIYEQVNE